MASKSPIGRSWPVYQWERSPLNRSSGKRSTSCSGAPHVLGHGGPGGSPRRAGCRRWRWPRGPPRPGGRPRRRSPCRCPAARCNRRSRGRPTRVPGPGGRRQPGGWRRSWGPGRARGSARGLAPWIPSYPASRAASSTACSVAPGAGAPVRERPGGPDVEVPAERRGRPVIAGSTPDRAGPAWPARHVGTSSMVTITLPQSLEPSSIASASSKCSSGHAVGDQRPTGRDGPAGRSRRRTAPGTPSTRGW